MKIVKEYLIFDPLVKRLLNILNFHRGRQVLKMRKGLRNRTLRNLQRVKISGKDLHEQKAQIPSYLTISKLLSSFGNSLESLKKRIVYLFGIPDGRYLSKFSMLSLGSRRK